MPWNAIRLLDGNFIPSIAFGTWTSGKGDDAVGQVEQAFEVGFDHIDTAQSYQNQQEVGVALRESGIKRSEVFVTTKFSGRDGLSIPEAIKQSLDYMGLTYVDLYLIHHPSLVKDDLAGAWRSMEDIKSRGLAKSIGVSNFAVKDLEELLREAKIKPAVNQILFHPYVYAQQRGLLEYCKAQGIVVEAYSALIPVTHLPGGPVDDELAAISKRTGASYDQILLAWAKAKGTVVVTNSSKKQRLEGYLDAGDLVLKEEEIAKIDAAGSKKVWGLEWIVFVIFAGLGMVIIFNYV